LNYTQNQKEAINFKDGNLQIIACAGSGKTDVITRRIATLIRGGIKSENVVAFTFTEKAAEEMKIRVRKHLQELRPENPEIGDMYVGTIHSFCFELLKDLKPKYRGYDVLDENKRILFLSNYGNFHQIKLSHLYRSGESRYRCINKFCRSVDVVREEMIDPERLPPEFGLCYTKYLDLLDERNFMDFSGMISEVVRLLEQDEEFAKKVRDSCKYVIVDEYQDINPLQEKLIRLMVGDSGNLCVVGDDDQCIYQWRGTNVDNILTFKNRYKDVKPIEIAVNFRSNEAIVESSRKLIEKNTSRLSKEIVPWKERKIKYEEGDVYAVFFDSLEDEANFIADRIEHLRGTKYTNNKGEEFSLDYRDVAIFFRSVKRSAEPYIRAFKERGIDYIVKGGGKLFGQDEVMLAVQSIGFLGGFDFGNDKITAESLVDLYNNCFQEWGDAEKFIIQLETLKEELGQESLISLQEIYQRILFYMGATDFEFKETQYYNLGMLSQAISDFEMIYGKIKVKQIKYFTGFIKGHAERSYEEGGQDDPTKINAVKIMTIHRAKGLQFPVVFLPNLINGRFPPKTYPVQWYVPEDLFPTKRYMGTIEDERKLFYVAITRSEKYLFLSGSKHIPERVGVADPSPFFIEFPKGCAVTTLIKDPTKRERLDLSRTEKLKGFPTSYSELRYYDRCPCDYKLRFVYGFNPTLAMALGYGRMIHNTLNIVHAQYRESPPSNEEIARIVDDNFFLRFAPEQFLDRFKDSAKRIIENYVTNFSGDLNLVLETEKSFEFALGDALISGSIDLIKKLDEKGEVEGIEIVDFKNREDSEMATDYEKQLKLYAVASLRSLGLHPKKATVHHLDDCSKSDVDISEKELERIENEVKNEITAIMNRDFPKRPDKKKCGACDWKYICTKEEA